MNALVTHGRPVIDAKLRLDRAIPAEAHAWTRYERTHQHRHLEAWNDAMDERMRAEDAFRRALAAERRRT